MIIASLTLLSILLAAVLLVGSFRHRKLQEQLFDQTVKWLHEVNSRKYLQRRVNEETGLSSATEVVWVYRRMCGALGSSLRNWGPEMKLSLQRRFQLSLLGSLLRELTSLQQGRLGEPAQIKGWLVDGQYGSGTELKYWKGADFGHPHFCELLDGLTFFQLMRLTVRLLSKGPEEEISLEHAFLDIDICLLTSNRFWADHEFSSYERMASDEAKAYKASRMRPWGDALTVGWVGEPVADELEEAYWRAQVKPRQQARDSQRSLEWFALSRAEQLAQAGIAEPVVVAGAVPLPTD